MKQRYVGKNDITYKKKKNHFDLQKTNICNFIKLRSLSLDTPTPSTL